MTAPPVEDDMLTLLNHLSLSSSVSVPTAETLASEEAVSEHEILERVAAEHDKRLAAAWDARVQAMKDGLFATRISVASDIRAFIERPSIRLIRFDRRTESARENIRKLVQSRRASALQEARMALV